MRKANGRPLALSPWLTLIFAAAPAVAHAQAGVERLGAPNPDQLQAPTYHAPAPDPFAEPLQSMPERPGRAATSTQFQLSEIDIDGNSIFSDADLSDLAAGYLNHPIGPADLMALRDAITQRYVQAGYLNSGAVIPDQDVSSGVAHINVVEGHLTGVEVLGLRHLHRSYLTSRVAAGGVLERSDLQESFERLSSDSNIAQINARLGPGAHPGEAILTLNVREADNWVGEAEAASSRSPSVGGERAAVRAILRNALGWGDRTALEYGRSEGLEDATLMFSAPLNRYDTTFTLEANGSDAKVVEAPLNDLDIISDSYSVRATLSQPLMRKGGASLTAGVGVSYAYAQTDLGGAPFSFSPGAVNGETNLTVARGTLDFLSQSPASALAIRSTLSYGLDALTQAPNAPDKMEKNFLSLAIQAQFVHATTQSGQQFIARAEVQVASHSLYALEQFTYGGEDSVRGYRKNQGLTDNGAVASVEYRAPLRDLSPWRRQEATGSPHWFAGVFVDAGYGWNTDLPHPAQPRLASAGLNLTWRPNPRFSATVYAAAQLEEIAKPADKSLQDYGFGFRITSRLW
jgi:hemolysin activation/secretion protein